MIDLSEMTYIELSRLYRQIAWELTIRAWWFYALIASSIGILYIIMQLRQKGKRK